MKRTETILAFVLLAAAVGFAACEISQSTAPSPVEVTITQPAPGTEPEPEPPGAHTGTISLEPAAVTVQIGAAANVKVIVKDANGQEIPSANISVNVVDKTVIVLEGIDGRILAFRGVAAGTTSAIISASGLQTSLAATVTP